MEEKEVLWGKRGVTGKVPWSRVLRQGVVKLGPRRSWVKKQLEFD